MLRERIDGWETRLTHLIQSRADRPFEWGSHDCALWAADCNLAVFGVDVASAYRGKYRSARGALRRLRQIDGVNQPIELADKIWGERLPPAMAKVGCIVAVDFERLGMVDDHSVGMGPVLGVCYGKTSLFVGIDGERPGLISVLTRHTEHCYG